MKSNAKNSIQTKASANGKARSPHAGAVEVASIGLGVPPPKEPLQESSNRQLYALRKVSISVAQQIASYAVIGMFIGFIALALYAVGRNAIPEFSGDEWIPQLAKLGFFCGLFVALFAIISALDRLVLTTAIGPLRDEDPCLTDKDRANLRKAHLTFVFQQVGIGFFSAAVFAALVVVSALYFPDSNVLGPLLAIFVSTLICMGSPWLIDKTKPNQYFPGQTDIAASRLFSGLAHLVHLSWLTGVIYVLAVQSQVEDSGKFTLLVFAVILSFAVYRLVSQGALIWVKYMRTHQARAIVALATMLTGLVAAVFFQQVVRMAMMGNLPYVSISLDGPLACTVLQHLKSPQKALCEVPPNDLAGKLLTFEVDVVSRVGASYIVAVPGALDAHPNGKCNPVHHGPASRKPNKNEEQKWFACVEVPREAIKLVPR